jgi:hypothetical protein
MGDGIFICFSQWIVDRINFNYVIMKTETFKSKNGINMIRCYPLNWQVGKKYAAVMDGELNPIFYFINIGSIDDMWQATLIPESMILSFCSLHYSHHEVYKFKVDSLEEASEMVLKFSKGMNRLDDIKETIYWN